MERLKKFYRADGMFFIFHKLKSSFKLSKKINKMVIYKHYISSNFLKSLPKFNILLEENHNIEINRKLTDFYSFIQRIKLNLLLRVNESDIINNVLNEKDYDLLNRYLITLSKYYHSMEKDILDRKMKKILNKFIHEMSPNLDLITLMYIFSSTFFDKKKYGMELLLLIEEKLFDLRSKNKNVIDKYIETYIKDNTLIFCLIDIINDSELQDILFEFFISILEKRIFHLNLAEAIACTIFLLEHRFTESYMLQTLSLRIVQICNSKNLSLDIKSYELVFDRLSLLKILLDFHKLSFDYHTETLLDDIFNKFLNSNLENIENIRNININCKLSDNEMENSKSKKRYMNKKQKLNNYSFNYNIDNKSEMNDFKNEDINENGILDIQSEILEKTFFSNSSIILTKKTYNEDEIETLVGKIYNKTQDINFLKRLMLKINPYDLFLLIKLLGKNSYLIKNLKNEIFQRIIDLAIDVYFSLECTLHNRLFFLLNISLIKDCIFIMKNLDKEDDFKKSYLNKLIKISYKQMIMNYNEITNILLFLSKDVDKDLIHEIEKEELKYYFTTITLQIFENFSLEKQNQKYTYFKDIVIEDMKNLVSMEIFNKKDLKSFVNSLKKDNLICEEFKENIIKTNNYYF